MRKITWRDVLDAYNLSGLPSLDSVNKTCCEIGYKFFAFNGIIYMAYPDNPVNTHIPVENLE
jgi:hypothetical protein